MKKKASILSHLERVAPLLSIPIYWENTDSIILGANLATFKGSGALTEERYIGKTLYDLYPIDMATHIKQHNEEVMRSGKTLSQEETIADISTGQIRYFIATKAPLHDDEGNVIGLVGTSVEITEEREKQRKILEEQEKFTKIASQVAHDIRSPLASLLMVIQSCTEIPEAERIALREAATSIGDIANNLLNRYKNKETDFSSNIAESEPIMVSATLLQLLADKKYEYQKLSLQLGHEFDQTGQFAFILIPLSNFKRMISNLINNAKDAFDFPTAKNAKIMVKLKATSDSVIISIEDNGKGMSPELISKIEKNMAVTEGKKEGHGLGLIQVREAIHLVRGSLSFTSTIGKGTIVTLTFPRIPAPSWIGEEILLQENDTIVILDDDNSIHAAWDSRLEPILKKSLQIQVKHFNSANETLNFFNALTPLEKDQIFLLTDYELLKQDLNGLMVIVQSKANRSLLVTSHYINPKVREEAEKAGTRILPKQLASEILIHTEKSSSINFSSIQLPAVDLIMVEDDKILAKNLSIFIFGDLSVDTYYSPDDFLTNIGKYPKSTAILLDNNFKSSALSGVELAEKLHAQGYTHLYLFSGQEFEKNELPCYLNFIRKDDMENIKKFAASLVKKE